MRSSCSATSLRVWLRARPPARSDLLPIIRRMPTLRPPIGFPIRANEPLPHRRNWVTPPTFSRPCFPRAWKRRDVQLAEFIDLATPREELDVLPNFLREKIQASQAYGVRLVGLGFSEDETIGENFDPADVPF